MITAEQVKKLMDLQQTKYLAALALEKAHETLERTRLDLDEYLAGLQGPAKPIRKQRSDKGISRVNGGSSPEAVAVLTAALIGAPNAAQPVRDMFHGEIEG